IYNIGLPALREALAHQPLAFAGVHCFFALMSSVQDTTILHRGGQDALDYAMIEAKKFMDAGGTFNKEWEIKATNIHKEFVRRRLSSGGIADLLAATLFVNRLEEAVPRRN
ncbi:MAG: triphosphoribosyl-dephospho-CoA synthase MdcB, partial [Lentisphaerae bacterium]|nr:triphosphoribosyl-dephospho-CoA synthase MdcB [Lentisphaerota bacterium]